MAILVNENSKIIIQGITGKTGRSFTKRMIKNDTPLVAGVSPGKGGQKVEGVPVYNTVRETVSVHQASVSFINVPAPFVLDAVYEAIDAGIKLVVIYSEGVSVHDSIKVINYAKIHDALIIGPNSAGVVSPEEANVSDIHDDILASGDIGIVSRSGTLTYEIVDILKKHGLGTSTIACLGGDPIIGLQHYEVLEMFEKDEDTKAVVYLGEIGGKDESLSAEVIRDMKTPVISYISGKYAPEGKQMGHAGAIVNSSDETADAKQTILKESGAVTIDTILELVDEVNLIVGR